MHRRILALAVSVVLAACGDAPDESTPADGSGQLVVERVEEDGMTVVRNLAGSKWGGDGTFRLQLEVGVDEGDERYMFNQPRGFWATEDEIFVMEPDDGLVRVYGFDGIHRRDFGRPGQGPGELENARAITVTDEGLVAVTSSSRGSARTAFFTLEGEFVEEWRAGDTTPGEGLFVVPFSSVMTDGAVVLMVFARNFQDPTDWEQRMGFVHLGPQGYQGEAWVAPSVKEKPAMMEVNFGGRSMEMPIQWTISAPSVAATPQGQYLWAHGDTYRFHVVTGEETLAIERVAERPAVQPGEAAFYVEQTVTQMQRNLPEFSWDGEGVPDHKPFIGGFMIDQAGKYWVHRPSVARELDPCIEHETPEGSFRECWRENPTLDVFEPSGEFLGSVQLPEGLGFFPFIRGDLLVASFEDEFGINKIRAYRLVLPGDEAATVP